MMTRKLRFFRQHSLETCGISCILMLLYYHHRVKYPTVKQERRLYGIYKCRAFKGVLAASAAECLSKNGLKVGLYHSSDALMDNRDGYLPEPLYRAMLEEYRETAARVADTVDIHTGCDLTNDWYRRQLEAGRLIMAQCIVPGDADGLHDHTLHWVLVCGYRDGCFRVCNPMNRKIELTEEEMNHYTDTPIGRCAIVVSE